ncbi:hypothetical protein TRFO_31179 [Tritrichomonas foetus]|uniref:SWIM-type domain-containing protein n=1 Tax=Tritrichomonas foetus TaxID=1144522 RepID=A0A1J4JE94_9EUKA|nr:hypothetical protein TRFO_11600 [Tritrichomonas foetus]OHS96969.1 hypothetical protein TRFO_36893 [Tritrichomonas foetus]OHT01893.1 hypothetical protein TRFO_31179 [Tritrichomonas foetus]|eukprot:OHS93789.1 hypothetical protein TRFO_11600 [Tritrichomonas foetus]
MSSLFYCFLSDLATYLLNLSIVTSLIFMSFFDPESLSTLETSSVLEMLRLVNIEAYKAGFELFSEQRFSNDYFTFYCRFGGRVRGHKTNKTGCPFAIKGKPHMTPTGKKYRINVENCICRHNHPLYPVLLTHKLITDDQNSTITNLYKIGISPSQIQKIIRSNFNIELTTLQISALTHSSQVENFGLQSTELIDYVTAEGGTAFPFELNLNESIKRLGVLTFMPQEIENLLTFGDVLFIDGTHANLQNQWEVVPLTVINRNRDILLAGIAYLAVSNQELLTWILHKTFFIGNYSDILQTLISDEDNAFIASVQKFHELINDNQESNVPTITINHIICALHKKRNFLDHLRSAGLNKSQRIEAGKLFDVVAYSTSCTKADAALNTLQNYNSKLTKYIQKEIIPLLSKFSRSHLLGIHANGFNTTSPAESMNAMLKRNLPTTKLTLKQSRVLFNRNHMDHCQALCYKRCTLRRDINLLFPEQILLNKRINDKIQIQYRISHQIHIIENPLDSEYPFFAFHENDPETKYKLNIYHCECNLDVFWGVPCSHLIKLSENFPVHAISPRWFEEEPNNTPIPSQSNDTIRFIKDTDQEEEEITEPDELAYADSVEYLQHLSPKQLYSKLFFESKQLASLASRNTDCAIESLFIIKEQINKILHVQTEQRNNPSLHPDQHETTDAIIDAEARPRGRPKKTKNSQNSRIMTEKCAICLHNHATTSCRWYGKVQRIQEKYANDSHQRHCSVCGAPDHNAGTCPIRQEAQNYYNTR